MLPFKTALSRVSTIPECSNHNVNIGWACITHWHGANFTRVYIYIYICMYVVCRYVYIYIYIYIYIYGCYLIQPVDSPVDKFVSRANNRVGSRNKFVDRRVQESVGKLPKYYRSLRVEHFPNTRLQQTTSIHIYIYLQTTRCTEETLKVETTTLLVGKA